MADTSFFGRPTRLFSTQAIVRVDSKGRRKVVDTDNRQRTNLSTLRDRYTNYKRLNTKWQVQHNRCTNKFVRDIQDYDAMDNDPIISGS